MTPHITLILDSPKITSLNPLTISPPDNNSPHRKFADTISCKSKPTGHELTIMPRHRSIQLRFIRRGSNDPDRDDILKVTKLGENSLRLVYTEKNQYDLFTDFLHLNYTQFLAYLYRTITLLTLDEDPFQSVQFFVPGYPTLMLSVSTLKQQTGYILEMITSTLWNWPAIGREETGHTSSHEVREVGRRARP